MRWCPASPKISKRPEKKVRRTVDRSLGSWRSYLAEASPTQER